jgi:hypothetical protein
MSPYVQEDLADRTKRFALAVVRLCIALPRSMVGHVHPCFSVTPLQLPPAAFRRRPFACRSRVASRVHAARA